MSTCFVYALIDPKDESVRYVGQTIQPVSGRLSQHTHNSNNPNRSEYKIYTGCWIRSLLKEGRSPEIRVLTELPNTDELDACEIYWISYFRGIGCKLTNIEEGGGHSAVSEGTKKRISATRRSTTHCKYGHEFSEENTRVWVNKKGTETRLCRTCRRELRRKQIERNTGRKVNVNNRDKTHCNRGHEFTPENTSWYGKLKDRRNCKECRNTKSRAKYKQLKQQNPSG